MEVKNENSNYAYVNSDQGLGNRFVIVTKLENIVEDLTRYDIQVSQSQLLSKAFALAGGKCIVI
ncbi:MAG TPA: hypothetical protein VE504_01405 [Nitrososphaeraceae archaeon]|nr:hypothetical protein [Nitrososphaeraceae archaeon]